ncbi:MAG: cytochrome c3 family protein [Deltaproteobacteria bacterium]|nr:cytochrome c3 family protein [Deltaproteobacteria bacterium]MCL5276275.1 cytochrome c3 family protein [Deltaproteobacteria bacterium]
MKRILLLIVVGLVSYNILQCKVYAEAVNTTNPHLSLPKGCASCHAGHGIAGTPMLVKNGSSLCFQCHGNAQEQNKARLSGMLLMSSPIPRIPDVEQDFQKPSHHPLDTVSYMTVMEQKYGQVNSTSRHAECIDCHSPHHLESAGISQQGQRKMLWFNSGMHYEYELCFECHANQPLPPYETDKAVEFNPSNASYHPVESPGKNYLVPSLIPPWTTSSYVNCTNCHSSDNTVGGSSPHGSLYAPILNKNYNKQDGMPESEYAYALCYQCHNRTSILGNQSFLYHREHVVNAQASCFTCHDSHGSINYPDLIRFNKDPRFTVVLPNSAGRLNVVFKTQSNVECFLSCHGVDHNPTPNLFTTTTKTHPALKPFNYNPGIPGPYFNPFNR